MIDWLAPWYPVGPGEEADAMRQELLQELARGHPLYGIPVRTVARRSDRDDVLFALEDRSGRVAAVHLTWTRSPPERLPWPGASLYSSMEEWIEEGMLFDHRDLP